MALMELGDVSEAIGVAAKVDFSTLPGVEVEQAAESVQQLKAELAALESEVVSAYDASMQWNTKGHRSAGSALRHRCRMHGGEAGAAVKLARALRAMPGTRLALADGAITANHARRLTRAATRPEFGDGEAFLLDNAAVLSYRDFDRMVTYWEQKVDENRRRNDPRPEPPDPREQKRALHLSRTLSDMGRLDGWLDPIGTTTVTEALRRIEQELFDNDWHTAKTEHGDTVTADRLWRTPAQRRADALVEMARRAMTAPPDGKRPEPLVIIHTDVDTFTTAYARLAGIPAPEPVGVHRLCETDDGTVLSPTQMIEHAIVGHIRRLVFESPGVILDYGRSQRLFTGALRQAIHARDRHCRHEGCEIPARHCEIDHITEWNNGGHTNHHNANTNCSYHHRNWKPRPG